MRRTRAHRSAGLVRSLTLLSAFLVAFAAILALAGLVLSTVLAGTLRSQALDESARDAAVYTRSVLAPQLVRGTHVARTPAARRRLARSVRTRGDVARVSFWSRSGALLLSTERHRGPGDVGRIESALHTRRPQSRLVDAPGAGGRAAVVWTPLLSHAGRPVAVAEVRFRPSAFEARVSAVKRTVWITIATVFGVVWLAVALFVRGAAAKLSRQQHDLQSRSRELFETTRELEESLLETIETLNAAVEARDPYTAGHSQRVRRVSLAIGHELRLPAKRLGTLGTASLFHDIGKIGIPDAILTKPEPLTPAEAAVMREHVTRGAEIVSRISSLQDAIPAIRHHHERWDGLGYPDGLAGDDIPLEAAIISLADAWDAMTTNRPYATALDLNAAMLQIRAGREKQFNPSVVDAFWAIAKRRPAEILPPGAPTAAAAVV